MKLRHVLPLLCATLSSFAGERSDTIAWTPREFFAAGRSSAMIAAGPDVTLERNVLIEDDAPACGYSSDPASVEILGPGIVLKKTLLLDRLPVSGASVVALLYPETPPTPNNGRHIIFTVNGHEIPYEVRHFWTHAPVPPGVLKVGENEILMRTLEPDARFKTWIALDRNYAIGSATRLRHPNRSARSTDGGKSWDDRHLGVEGKADGEYSIRLNLNSYQPQGWIESPVVDLAAQANVGPILQPVRLLGAQIDCDSNIPGGTSLAMEARSGPDPGPGRGWGPWERTTGEISATGLRGRFLQFRFTATTDRSDRAPVITGIRVRSKYETDRPELVSGIRSVKGVRYPILRSSFPFAYEDPTTPRLKRFRATMGLDRVVGDARTELEKMLRIRGWVARQWEWHLLKPEQELLEWNAEAIMTPGRNGKVDGGFCLHYAVVLMQALQSFGFPARIVSVDYSIWGGHEVVEVWSNEFGKWIFLDANFDTHFIDPTSGVPLNALEMHDIFLKEYFPGEAIDRDRWTREDLVRRAEEHGATASATCVLGGNARSATLTAYAWWNPPLELSPYCGGYGPLVMGYLRYLPRANYLSVPRPIPVNHGRTHWGWTGYYVWEDRQTPRSLEHSTFTSRRSDLYWNVNQIDFRAIPLRQGVLRFAMETNAPHLKTFALTVNGRSISTVSASFDVVLERGANRVEMRVVDAMGNPGSVSSFDCLYSPGEEPNKSTDAAAATPKVRIDTELIDTLSAWCSPLWGHHAAKIVRGKAGDLWAALFSGDYPEARVQIWKRPANGIWQRGQALRGAYQPTLLFLDGEERLNLIQNSQTKPILHLRSARSGNADDFRPVAEGNGLADGRGWYVGAGIVHDTIYMAYVTLAYDLFLTWKRVADTEWRPAVLIHKGSVDTTIGNHSWTRPHFQFAGRRGYFVVNETSDGSVKNSYSAAILVSFDLADPRQFTTERISEVPQGFGCYSPDFLVSEGGDQYCIIERNARLYPTEFVSEGETGVFVYSRPAGESRWSVRRLFDSVTDAALLSDRDGSVSVVRIASSKRTSPGDRASGTRKGQIVWEGYRSVNRGISWHPLEIDGDPSHLSDPSHIQGIASGTSTGSGMDGLFEDRRNEIPGTKRSAFGLYRFRLSEMPRAAIEIVDTTHAWSSPCWGYNAPKIVTNAKGDLWAVNWGGKYGDQRAYILKRQADGKWLRGMVFDSCYQPSMIFLDSDGRLNYIQNAQTAPIRHYRSTDDENLHHFDLVATGNGIPDGRGWYVGVGVHGRTMYMAYVTLQYDLYYTWKEIADREWHPAVLVEPGVVDTARGNHSWLYPRFTFFGDRGYITASSTVDGSKQNTYNSVHMVSFPLSAPEKFVTETVFEGAAGYYSYSYDTIITPDSLILCGFNAGRYRYGPRRPDMPPAGLYVAFRKVGGTGWTVTQVDEGDGGLAFHVGAGGDLYALVTRGSWDQESQMLLKRSTDRGRSWSTVLNDVTAGKPPLKHQFFAQTLRTTSGSTVTGETLRAIFTSHASATPVDGLFRFDLLHLLIKVE